MIYRVETPTGSISFSKNIIGRIVLEAVLQFGGKVMVSNHKGKTVGLSQKRGGLDAIGTMDITMGAKGLDLRIYVVIRFGTSIGMVTDRLIEGIYMRTKELTGLAPNSVAIVVTGMISKQQMARRNIEVIK
ncbi:MAG: Asp23/Gls24 family envelope stress response protein [Clostridiales bacterium]|nr:Asp23/Gls24 family envelope stress response protein [Clostridiales bacterium]